MAEHGAHINRQSVDRQLPAEAGGAAKGGSHDAFQDEFIKAPQFDLDKMLSSGTLPELTIGTGGKQASLFSSRRRSDDAVKMDQNDKARKTSRNVLGNSSSPIPASGDVSGTSKPNDTSAKANEQREKTANEKPIVRDKNGAIVCKEYMDLSSFVNKDTARIDNTGRLHVDLGKGNHASFPAQEGDGTELRVKDKFSGQVEIVKDSSGNAKELTITQPEGITAYGSKFIGKEIFGKKIGKTVWDEAQVTKAHYKDIGSGKCAVTLTTSHHLTGEETQPARVRDISALTDLASYVDRVRKPETIASK